MPRRHSEGLLAQRVISDGMLRIWLSKGKKGSQCSRVGRGFVSEGFEHSDRRVNCDEAALPCVEPHLRRLDCRHVGCDAAIRVSNASYHLAVVASDVLPETIR